MQNPWAGEATPSAALLAEWDADLRQMRSMGIRDIIVAFSCGSTGFKTRSSSSALATSGSHHTECVLIQATVRDDNDE